MTLKGDPNTVRRVKQPKVITETDGDFYLETPDHPSCQTFRITNQSGEILRGCFYSESKRNYVFLQRHECIEDIYATSEHESIHAALDVCRDWEFDEIESGKLRAKDSIRMDDNEEHNMIRIALLADCYDW